MSKLKILVIEDDQDLREGLTQLLEVDYEVASASDGFLGLKMALRDVPHLILLDLKMPGIHGLEVCKLFRADKEFDHVPIIVLSGFNDTASRTQSFDAGADDFIQKPFAGAELLTRIRRKIEVTNLTNRKDSSATSEKVVAGDLELDWKNQQVTIAGENVSFSALEFRLLHLLASNYKELVSKEEIIQKVWSGQEVPPTIMAPHLVSIRNKIASSDCDIASVYGKGYRLQSRN